MPAKKKRRCSPARSRQKGADFERWITNKLKDAGLGAKRGGTAQASVNITMPDVLLDGWHIESKQGKKNYVNPPKALEQAERDRDIIGSGYTPVAITRVDGERQVWCWMRAGQFVTFIVDMGDGGGIDFYNTIVAIRFEDWVELVKAGAA